jgi:hypothetical protein
MFAIARGGFIKLRNGHGTFCDLCTKPTRRIFESTISDNRALHCFSPWALS